jgi:NAD(P)-dependent dehydrogenase (short-subunit alcohol dehydrogenase family)
MPVGVIWGASGGIGSALVRGLKAQGWTVYGIARDSGRIPVEADAGFEFEASDDYAIKQAAYAVAQQVEAVDLVVYAAGMMRPATVEAFSPADWSAVMDANLNGAARTAAASLPLLREGGALVLIGAYVDSITLPRFSAYAAAKAGLAVLADVLAKENRKLKITLARPGAVDTPFWANVPFKLPAGAQSAEVVAAAIIEHCTAGRSGTLDL